MTQIQNTTSPSHQLHSTQKNPSSESTLNLTHKQITRPQMSFRELLNGQPNSLFDGTLTLSRSESAPALNSFKNQSNQPSEGAADSAEETTKRIEDDEQAAQADSANAETHFDSLDITTRSLLQMGHPTESNLVRPNSTTTPSMQTHRTPTELAETHALAQALVERAAFWGDGQRGVARLRFGASAQNGLAGVMVELHSDSKGINLKVDGADEEIQQRIAQRLKNKGIALADEE